MYVYCMYRVVRKSFSRVAFSAFINFIFSSKESISVRSNSILF